MLRNYDIPRDGVLEPLSATKEMKESKAAEKMRNMANEYDVLISELEKALVAPSSGENSNINHSSGDFKNLHSIHRPSTDQSESSTEQQLYGYKELRNELSEMENKTYI